MSKSIYCHYINRKNLSNMKLPSHILFQIIVLNESCGPDILAELWKDNASMMEMREALSRSRKMHLLTVNVRMERIFNPNG